MNSYQDIKKIVIIDSNNPVNEEITTIRSENNSDKRIKNIFNTIKSEGDYEKLDHKKVSYKVPYKYIKSYIEDSVNEPKREEKIIGKIVYE